MRATLALFPDMPYNVIPGLCLPDCFMAQCVPKEFLTSCGALGRRLLILLPMLFLLNRAQADDSNEPSENDFHDNFVALSYAQNNGVTNSNDNPGNQLAKLPQTNATLELLPEFSLTTGMLKFQLSPRMLEQWNQVQTSGVVSNNEGGQAYLNGWGVRFTPNDAIAMSVGREVLLWGPAMSYSPSDPFYIDNGRSNPNIELYGKDFVKTAWFIDNAWTLNYIDNFGKGVIDLSPPGLESFGFESFHRTRVLKLDHTGNEMYWSVNYAKIEDLPDKIGFSMQRTVSDAVLVYADGGYNLHRTQYQIASNNNEGLQFAPPSGGGLSGIGILGMAYTLQAGPLFTIEYINNNQGWSNAQAHAYQLLAQNSVNQLGTRNTGFAMQELARGADPGSILLRQNYLFLQYFHQNLMTDLDLTMRLTRNLDDNGMQIVNIIEKRMGNRYNLFGQIALNTGGSSTEFGRYISRQFLFGFRTDF